MKKMLLFIISIIFINPIFAQSNIELINGCEYVYFSKSKVIGIKSNNPNIISAQKVSTYTGDSNQIIFYTKKTGSGDIQIITENGIEQYHIEIKNSSKQINKDFIKIDVPGMEN
ncbi:hypothetical protein IJG14_03675 [bacterium]|nr:hypothetical protein [bacterium]